MLFGSLVGVGSCDKVLPTAPSELLTGVAVYEHANFLGASAHITKDVSNLANFKGPCEHYGSGSGNNTGNFVYDWNDCISSVRVAPGWIATLYRDDGFRDDSIEVTDEESNLQLIKQHDCPKDGLNDCVTSIRVRRR